MHRLAQTFLAVTATVLLLAVPASAGASPVLEQLTLEANHGWSKHATPEVSSNVPLTKGLYVATVKGTISYWSAKFFAKPHPTKKRPWTMICGTPEPAPEFASTGGSGLVGMDAEFVFARPWDPQECTRWPLPRKWWQFQMNAGAGWAHPSVLTLTWPEKPSPTHTYEYAINQTSLRHRVGFRLLDKETRDNYGSLLISLRPATPADCTGGRYLAFKLASAAECETKA